jgi:muramoyltetrapeptide carboxypeptidase
VVAPASGIAARVPRRVSRGVAEWERLGFRVRLGATATREDGYVSAPVADRVADLHAMFQDPAVRAIVTTIGGYNSNGLLDRLDYDLIQAHPKIVMGYSDITALLVAITTRTGLVTFQGPALLPQFGEADGLDPYTRDLMLRMLTRTEPVGAIPPAPHVVDELLQWDEEDDRPRRRRPNPGPMPLTPGVASGPLVAANLATLLHLAGTPFWPRLSGAILVIEDDEEETPATWDRGLTQLRLMGVFDEVAALLIGRLPPAAELETALLGRLVQAVIGPRRFPVALDLDFGHWDPIMVLPIGVRASVAVSPDGVRLAIEEAAVV